MRSWTIAGTILIAWIDFLKAKIGVRVGMIGHSLGAVKCLYALAHEASLQVAGVVAISPPRLAYSWFCGSPEGPAFLETYQRAEACVQAGQPAALLDVKLPLPIAITAAGYVEKYGPEERYNYLRFLNGVRAPLLVTFGEREIADNMAFRAAPAALAELAPRQRQRAMATIPAADHFYTQARGALTTCMEDWLRGSINS